MPPLPVKSSGVIFERGGQKAGLPSAAHAHGHQLRRVQRAARLPALRLVSRLHVRVPRQVHIDGGHAAARRGHRPLRDPAGQLCSHDRNRRVGSRHWRDLFRCRPARAAAAAKAVVLCANGAETPRLLLNSASGPFAHGWPIPAAWSASTSCSTATSCVRCVRAPAQRVQGVQTTRMILDFYETDPHRGFYGGGGIDARFSNTPSSSPWADCRRTRRTWGAPYKSMLGDNYNAHVLRHALHITAARVQQHHAGPDAEGCLGPARAARDVPRPRGRSQTHSSCGSRDGNPRSRGRERHWPAPVTPQTQAVHLLGTCRMGNDPRTSVVDRYHRTHDVPQSLHLRREQHGHLDPRPAHRDHLGTRVPRRRQHR